MIRVDVLGPLVVTNDGEPVGVGGPQPQVVLLTLIHHLGKIVSFDTLIDTLWGNTPPRSARNSVQVKVSALRNALGPTFELRTVPSGYLLEPGIVDTDLAEFEHLHTRAATLLDTDPATASAAARSALALWRDDPSINLPDTELFRHRAAALDEQRTHTRVMLIDAQLRLGHHTECCPEVEALAEEHPFREDIRCLHLLALYRSSRQTEALRAFRTTRELLIEELGIEPGSVLQTLHRRILEQDETLHLDTTPQTRAPIASTAREPTTIRKDNLRSERDTFIERPEIDQIVGLLRPGQPITVVGTGGIGKSRCVAAVARRCRDDEQFADGVWIVDLAPLPDDTDDIGAAVASAMGLGRLPEASPTEGVISYLASRHALVVLDNCEHVADAAARFIRGILDGAPATAVLVASRVRLSVFPESLVTIESLSDDAALHLLNTRVAEAGAQTFPLDDCLELCAMLDNYPLAIELAAARTTTMSAAEIVARLAQQPSLLRARSARDPSGTRRHADLATALDWSLAQLSPRARDTLTRATVFVSDFDLASAEAILSSADVSTIDVVDDLGELVEHHLVTREHGRARFRLLEPIRQHLHPGVPSETEQRYGEYFAAFTTDAADGLQGPREAVWWDRLRRELPHVQQMVRWAADRGDVELLDPMFTALVPIIVDHPALGEAAVDALRRLGCDVIEAPGVALGVATHCVNIGEWGRCAEILELVEPVMCQPKLRTASYAVRVLAEPHERSWVTLFHDAAIESHDLLALATAKILRGDADMLSNADALANPSRQVLARMLLSTKTTDGTAPESRANKAELYRLAMISNNEKTIINGLTFMAFQHCYDNEPRRAGPLAIDMIERVIRLRSPGFIWHSVDSVASMLAMLGIEPFTSVTLWAGIDAHPTHATWYRNPKWPDAVAAQLTEDERATAQLEGVKLSADEAARLALKAAETIASL